MHVAQDVCILSCYLSLSSSPSLVCLWQLMGEGGAGAKGGGHYTQQFKGVGQGGGVPAFPEPRRPSNAGSAKDAKRDASRSKQVGAGQLSPGRLLTAPVLWLLHALAAVCAHSSYNSTVLYPYSCYYCYSTVHPGSP